jgi:hypothetical protein
MAFKKYQKVEAVEPVKRTDLPVAEEDEAKKPKLAAIKKTS